MAILLRVSIFHFKLSKNTKLFVDDQSMQPILKEANIFQVNYFEVESYAYKTKKVFHKFRSRFEPH
jgi:hypothetical protein